MVRVTRHNKLRCFYSTFFFLLLAKLHQIGPEFDLKMVQKVEHLQNGRRICMEDRGANCFGDFPALYTIKGCVNRRFPA
jgi:hypothetical protein